MSQLTLDLNTVWFILVGVLLTGYAMLDGFDLGVGALHLLVVKDDRDRRLFINSIGPVWDGNEVWLVTGGGALFAAFPLVYAEIFSGFYLAFMLLLCTLIFRAVSIEFRSKQPATWWRKMWDVGFSVGSIGASLLIGVALGNIVSADVTYANNLDRIETIRSDGKIEGADPTIAALTGKIDVRFADTTLLTQAINGTAAALEFSYALGSGESLTLTAHAVYLPRPRIEIKGPKGVQASFDWQAALATSPARMCTAVLINSIASYA